MHHNKTCRGKTNQWNILPLFRRRVKYECFKIGHTAEQISQLHGKCCFKILRHLAWKVDTKLTSGFALQQDRSVFPINLVVVRLSGTGSEAIYMGAIKFAVTEDPNVVKLWTTTTGIIMCADQKFSDWFGVTPTDMLGRSFTSLGTEIEVLEK